MHLPLLRGSGLKPKQKSKKKGVKKRVLGGGEDYSPHACYGCKIKIAGVD